MQVQVHDVHPEVPGPGHAHQGVHVGAVHVDQAAHRVQGLADVLDPVFEDPQGVGVGDHEPGHLLAQLGQEGVEALLHLAVGAGDVRRS